MDQQEEDDMIAQQEALAMAKFGKLKKKNPATQKDQKKFDSADHEMEQQKMKEQIGLGEEKKE